MHVEVIFAVLRFGLRFALCLWLSDGWLHDSLNILSFPPRNWFYTFVKYQLAIFASGYLWFLCSTDVCLSLLIPQSLNYYSCIKSWNDIVIPYTLFFLKIVLGHCPVTFLYKLELESCLYQQKILEDFDGNCTKLVYICRETWHLYYFKLPNSWTKNTFPFI